MSPREARALAEGRRGELRRRARRIRRSVAAVSAALLIGLFLVVYVQLASGHDPALSASSKARTTTTTSSGSSGGTSTTSTQSSGGSHESSSESSGEASQSSESTSTMTTSQS